MAKIFIVEDDELITSTLGRILEKEGYEVRSETKNFENIGPQTEAWGADILLLDVALPGQSGIDILEELRAHNSSAQVVILTSDNSAETAVKCMKLGAADYLIKPFNWDKLKIVIRGILEKEKSKREVSYLCQVYSELFNKELVGESAVIKELKIKMEKIARARVPNILITGESGTGKELVARCLHRLMNEGKNNGYSPFIPLNCTAIPEQLLESELFGFEKGAFTDARTGKKGLLELANGGTIFLDEIGDMKLDLQAKLLRILEERTVRKIGGQKEIPVNVTVIATTNKDLSVALKKGEFRSDLFYRLNIFSLYLPPLRERREDIIPLARHFIAYFGTKYNNRVLKSISSAAEKIFYLYDWPGNVRELRNIIERIVVLENSQEILPHHLPPEMIKSNLKSFPDGDFKITLPETGLSLENLKRDLLIQALQRAKNNKSLAARLLNISYDSFRYQIKKFHLG